MRILFCTEYMIPSKNGIATRCHHMVQALRRQGHHVQIYTSAESAKLGNHLLHMQHGESAGTSCKCTCEASRRCSSSSSSTSSVPECTCKFDCRCSYNTLFSVAASTLGFPTLDVFFCLPTLQLLLDVAFGQRYDAIHVFAPPAYYAIPIYFLAWLRGIKVIVSHHVNMIEYAKVYLPWYLHTLAFLIVKYTMLAPVIFSCQPQHVCAPSPSTDFEDAWNFHTNLLPSAVDTGLFCPPADYYDDTAKPSKSSHQHDSTSSGDEKKSKEEDVTCNDDEKEDEPVVPVIRQRTVSSALQLTKVSKSSSNVRRHSLLYVGRLNGEKNMVKLLDLFRQLPAEFAKLKEQHRQRRQMKFRQHTRKLKNNEDDLAAASDFADDEEECDDEFLQSNDEFALDIVGCGPEGYLQQCRHFIKQHDIPNVTWVGPVAHHLLPPYYQRASMFVTCSLTETFGFTCIEALACATPILYPSCDVFDSLYQKQVPEGRFFLEAEQSTHKPKQESLAVSPCSSVSSIASKSVTDTEEDSDDELKNLKAASSSPSTSSISECGAGLTSATSSPLTLTKTLSSSSSSCTAATSFSMAVYRILSHNRRSLRRRCVDFAMSNYSMDAAVLKIVDIYRS